ncbi:MAG: protease modulator HflC [Thermotogae bacterium]|nr:protease modulator HflC [Thermotogota bacterium]
MKAFWWFLGIFIAFFVVFALVTYTVDETQLAIRLRFGKIMDVHDTAGIHFKAPFIDKIEKRDKRIMLYDIAPESVLTVDKKRLEVDSFILWRISDSKTFLETLNNTNSALNRIDDIVYSNIRDSFAKLTISDIISEDRRAYLESITNQTSDILKTFGVQVTDVNVKRTDLPDTNAKAVFERMKSERYQAAAKIRAEGEKEYKEIVARAEKESSVLIAEANKQAEEIRGKGDASALEVYASAFSKDPEFYHFWRSLTAYESVFQKEAVVLLDEKVDFLQYLFSHKAE